MSETPRRCAVCDGPIATRSVGDDYFTGEPILRWLRTDLVMVGCPATNSHGYCVPRWFR